MASQVAEERREQRMPEVGVADIAGCFALKTLGSEERIGLGARNG